MTRAVARTVFALVAVAASVAACELLVRRAERAAASVAAGWPSMEEVAAFRAVVNRRIAA